MALGWQDSWRFNIIEPFWNPYGCVLRRSGCMFDVENINPSRESSLKCPMRSFPMRLKGVLDCVFQTQSPGFSLFSLLSPRSTLQKDFATNFEFLPVIYVSPLQYCIMSPFSRNGSCNPSSILTGHLVGISRKQLMFYKRGKPKG